MTLVKLEVTPTAYAEIRAKLVAAGAEELLMSDGALNMDGIALVKGPETSPVMATG